MSHEADGIYPAYPLPVDTCSAFNAAFNACFPRKMGEEREKSEVQAMHTCQQFVITHNKVEYDVLVN